MEYTLSSIANAVEKADPRLRCTVNETLPQVIVTSDSRPDVPDGVNLIAFYYYLRLKRGKFNQEDMQALIDEAIAFADANYLNGGAVIA